jgi:choline dehydrogenase
MLYVRGNKADYDDWAKMGATGWNYENVLPYFVKAENTEDKQLKKSRKHMTCSSPSPVTSRDTLQCC